MFMLPARGPLTSGVLSAARVQPIAEMTNQILHHVFYFPKKQTLGNFRYQSSVSLN